MRLRMILLFALALLASGCGGSSQDDSGANTKAVSEAPAPSGSTEKAAPTVHIGVGPIKHVDLATLDMSAAPQGAEIFNTTCSACHKLDERYIGPALEGVTTRRAPEWILNMILNPDVMVKEDETARGLLAEYLAPMTNMNLTEEQAKSVLAFFLEHDKGLNK